MSDLPPEPGIFTRQLRALLQDRRRPDGSPLRYVDVVLGTDGRVQSSYLGALVRATGPVNPSYEIILALCHYFQVDANYFFPQTVRADSSRLEE